MNDITVANNKSNTTVYAEDTVLLISLWWFHVDLQVNTNNITELSSNISIILGNIQEWLNINWLTFNVQQTKLIIIRHYKCDVNHFILEINEQRQST